MESDTKSSKFAQVRDDWNLARNPVTLLRVEMMGIWNEIQWLESDTKSSNFAQDREESTKSSNFAQDRED